MTARHVGVRRTDATASITTSQNRMEVTCEVVIGIYKTMLYKTWRIVI